MYTLIDLLKLHDRCRNNKEELNKSSKCGCFYCKKIYDPKEISEWTDNGQTAICPYCSIDSVISNPSKEDLDILHKYYFKN